MLNVPVLREPGFALEPLGEAAGFRFTGNGDTEAVAPLDRFLKLVHEDMRAQACHEVTVDVCELYFMNSSCIKAFVSWVYGVKSGPTSYRIRILMNPRLQWQARTFNTLHRLSPTHVHIENSESYPPVTSESA